MATTTKPDTTASDSKTHNGAQTTLPAVETAAKTAPAEKVVAGVKADEKHILTPSGQWPPPIYITDATSDQERYYMEHRWHAQWDWYDQKASFYKKRHLFIQVMIGIMSGAVPVLVAINSQDVNIAELLKLSAIVLSFLVTVFTVWENVYKHGDNWRSYRGAAEDLAREKAMYDMEVGPYKRVKNPFSRFVERTEDIIAKQNGQWLSQMSQSHEEEDKNDDNASDDT